MVHKLLDTLEYGGMPVEDLLLSMDPSNMYYLMSEQALKFNRHFVKEFESIRDEYLELYKNDPAIVGLECQ